MPCPNSVPRRAAALFALAFVACAACAQKAPAAAGCADLPCGRVESIRQVSVKETWAPLGTTATASVGARSGTVTTYEIAPGGAGRGIVLLGASGGAAYRKSPNAYDRPQWQVSVRLDGGGSRTVTLGYEPFVREGDRVRVAGSSVELVD